MQLPLDPPRRQHHLPRHDRDRSPPTSATPSKVFVVPRTDGEYGRVGTVADVVDSGRLPGGITRGHAHRPASRARRHRQLRARRRAADRGRAGPRRHAADERTRELEREYRAVVEEILELRGDDGRVSAFLRSISEPGALADTSGYSPDLSLADKQRLLETVDVTERLELALELQRERLAELQVRRGSATTSSPAPKAQQREYFLRKQMESIRKELGDDDASVVEEYERKIAESKMPDAVREQAQRELGRLERMGEASGESSMIRTYLDWLLGVPWGERSEERLDPVHAREVLDADHAGLEDVKDRITEYIAVRRLRRERGLSEEGRGAGAILTLIGPPGTGKTSIGESIARATGREFVRMSLGGVRDEAEIRGHRRTYIGALPGRLVRALKDAKHDEPGDHARRGRQGRRRLARRPELGPARGARPGPEPLVPRPLPRRRARPLRGAVHRHGERRRDDPRAAARPHGGGPLRRLHDRREGRDRARLPVAAPDRAQRAARRRGRDLRRAARGDRHRVHPRGRRTQPRARARQAAAKDRDQDRLRGGDRRRSRSTPTRSATRSAASASSRRRPSAPRSPASPPASR